VLRLITLETLIICLAGGLGGILAGAAVTPMAGTLLRGTLVGYVPAGSIAAPTAGIALLSLSVAVAAGRRSPTPRPLMQANILSLTK
jgi:hypothetical protein